MTIYLGKRAAGGLTKASPGDTLYIPFSTFNDSGAPITDTGLSHTKVEIYKNNEGTARATDSGVWLGDSGLNYEIAGTRVAASAFEDTGQYGNVTGLYSIGIRLFNTSDDTGFFDAGSTYHVSIQGLKVKAGQGWVSMNFFPAMFEIAGKRVQAGAYTFQGAVGFPQTDIWAVLGDTGAANLDQGRFGVLSDSGRAAAVLDTGKVASAIWTSHATRALTAFQFDTGVWGSNFASGRTLTSFQFDTGVWGSNFAGGRILTSFGFDTGVRDTIWRASPSGYTSDTGSFGYTAGRLMAVRTDTGAAHLSEGRLGVAVTALSDTGVNARIATLPQAIMDLAAVDGRKVVEVLRLMTAVLGGTVSGAGTGTEIFKSSAAVPATRVTATVDSSGNRTAITYALDT